MKGILKCLYALRKPKIAMYCLRLALTQYKDGAYTTMCTQLQWLRLQAQPPLMVRSDSSC